MKIVALIPARAGSQRLPGKNWKPLAGVPLVQWTIQQAQDSGSFTQIVLCTDDHWMGDTSVSLAGRSSIHLHLRRPAADTEPDIAWVQDAITMDWDAFAILRPTSPFRTADTIRRAVARFQEEQPADSLRAVEPVTEHPGKMWVRRNGRLLPLLPFERDGIPWHSCPTQALPLIYRQNASLEIAWTKTVHRYGSISGPTVIPFITDGWEGFDINTPEDWDRAERHAQTLLARV